MQPIAEVGKPPIDQPVKKTKPQPSVPYMQPVNQTSAKPTSKINKTNDGFVPLKKENTSNKDIPSGFVPVKKN